MAVRASKPELEIVLNKARGNSLASGTVELRLKSGDVDADVEAKVAWSAFPDAWWLLLDTASGSVSSIQTVASLVVTANGTGMSDTSESGPLKGSIAFHSASAIMSESDFVGGTSSLGIAVLLTVVATPYIEASDVSITTSAGRVFDSGATVSLISGESFTVTILAFDCDRLPIPRAGQQILLSIVGEAKSATMLHVAGNRYCGDVPDSWIKRPGNYLLRVVSGSSDAGGFASPFDVRLHVRCGDTDDETDGQCRRRCRDADGLWFDSNVGLCKKRPQMALKTASDKLSFTHTKAKARGRRQRRHTRQVWRFG
jgi:hypothetical protein